MDARCCAKRVFAAHPANELTYLGRSPARLLPAPPEGTDPTQSVSVGSLTAPEG
jgi:hypothetical protein